ncbi:MAG: sulfate adenylyltransferase, partial [Bacillales bacterium]
VRTNADRIYKDIFNEYSYVADTLRTAQPEWVTDAREAMCKQQEMVIQSLEEKVKNAPEKASDEFMYQDKSEAEKELSVARRILEDIPVSLRPEDLRYRIWNTLPYHRYRGKDKD